MGWSGASDADGRRDAVESLGWRHASLGVEKRVSWMHMPMSTSWEQRVVAELVPYRRKRSRWPCFPPAGFETPLPPCKPSKSTNHGDPPILRSNLSDLTATTPSHPFASLSAPIARSSIRHPSRPPEGRPRRRVPAQIARASCAPTALRPPGSHPTSSHTAPCCSRLNSAQREADGQPIFAPSPGRATPPPA